MNLVTVSLNNILSKYQLSKRRDPERISEDAYEPQPLPACDIEDDEDVVRVDSFLDKIVKYVKTFVPYQGA